jgi:hypothetical protein
MLTQYKNIDKILNAKTSISGERFVDSVKSKLKYVNVVNPVSRNLEIATAAANIELHIYANDTWITGNHVVKTTPSITNNIVDSSNGKTINFNSTPVTIDLYKEFEALKINGGKFRFVVNFHKNLIGNYNTQYLAIDQISDDRTELKLYSTNLNVQQYKQELNRFIQTVANGKQTVNILNGQTNVYKSYLLNFSRNKNVAFVNSVVVGDYVYIKLLDPLPDDIDLNFKCWIVEEQKPSYIDNVSISSYVAPKKYNNLSMPNWYANANYNTSTSTGLKNWNDLLGNGLQTSQQIVDTYFSSSGTQLNIDYRDFNNFVFYSSATERIKNFKYKLELLEYYKKQSNSISLISGSIATTNAADYDLRQSNLIGGFDAFEKFLYYESSSRLTTYDNPSESPNVPNFTGSYISPAPKVNSIIPYINASVTSSAFTNWYTGLLDSASLYDSLNLNKLRNAIPEYVLINSSNGDLELFVDMLGHHYDVIYTYVNHMSKIYNREENPKLGMPNELLYSVAKQFGWNLTNGNQQHDIWQYIFGTDESGIPITGSTTVNGTSLPSRDITYTVWRRIVNNLPLLLKSKGTSRSIKALLSCYGIPQSTITIKEYGGPRIDRVPVYEKLNFDYALDLINNSAGTVNVNYSQSLNAVELRFRTDNAISNPLLPSTMNLYTIGNNAVTIDYTSGTLGKIRINGTASANIEMFDGGWLNTVLRTDGNKLEVVAKKSKYGKIVAAVSASATASFGFSGSLTMGGTSTGAVRLQGQLQELRLWSSSLDDSPFDNHTKAPSAYDGNIDAYDELFFRLPLTQKINHNTTSSIIGVQPVEFKVSASFAGWSNAEPYDSLEETYYYGGISLGAGTFDDNKIRIESNELVGNLDIKTRAELSQYDTAPLDSNKLGVYFSPQTMINEDIIAQLGFTILDDFIGDPGETEKKSYPELIRQSKNYWKKYTDKNDINSYIKIFTLYDLSFFKQLEQLIPARVKTVSGILIQPNLLERSKDTVLPTVKYNDYSYETKLSDTAPSIIAESILLSSSMGPLVDLSSEYINTYAEITASNIDISSEYINYQTTITASTSIASEFINYFGKLSTNVVSINGFDDDQLLGYLTSSADKRYGGTPYSHTYLYKSGSTYITGSTPYWMSEAVMPNYNSPIKSLYRTYKTEVAYSIYGLSTYGTGLWGTYNPSAEIQDYLPTGLNNLWYAGSKLSSPGFNIKSTDTIDGGPVVEWSKTTGNQLVYQQVSGKGQLDVKSSGNII